MLGHKHTFVIAGSLLLCGCSGQNSFLQTGALQAPPATTAAAPAVQQAKVDPACAVLAAQIDTIRKEGVTDRLEKVSTGKSKTVSVKRTSIARMVELAKADADYQAKCSHPGARMAQVQPVAVQPAAVAAAPAAPVAAPAAPAATPKPQ